MKRVFLLFLILQSSNLFSAATVNPCQRVYFSYDENNPKYRYYPDTIMSTIADDTSFYTKYAYYSYYSY